MNNSWKQLACSIGGSLLLINCALALVKPAGHSLPDFDGRKPAPGADPAAVTPQNQALTQLRRSVPDVRADFDEVLGAPKWVTAGQGFLTGPEGKGIAAQSFAAIAPQDPHRITRAFLEEHRAMFGHGSETLNAARIKREFTTPHNRLHTVVWEQQVDEIPVFEALLISHTTKKNELVSIGSTLLPDANGAADAGTPGRAALQASPKITALRAVTLAAANLEVAVAETELTAPAAAAGPEQQQSFKSATLKGITEVKLTWLPLNKNSLRLCWDVILTSPTRDEMFRVLVDAVTGEVRLRRCLTAHRSNATYNVFTSDSPSPFSPSHAAPLTKQPPVVSRTLVTTAALSTNASPNGWIDDGVNETRGNNVDAHTDWNYDNLPDVPRPQGAPSRVFNFPIVFPQSVTNHAKASVVQLFYLCNWMHDKLFEMGFTEAAGNFQNNNFGRGGLGGDALQADAQDGGGFNNANMSTPPDGFPPRMQMYIFYLQVERDGSLDAEVVLHEYTHGLSNRRVGGGVGLSTLQSVGMGEGWSDFYALSLLSEPNDDVNGCTALGGYVTYSYFGWFMENYYYGIRRYPYSTDLNKNPLTFKDIDPAHAIPHENVPKSSLNTSPADEVHNQGEVWCMMLWEGRARLIEKYGHVTGNQLMLQLVTDGMNLSPMNPNFVQARDAILQADLVNNGGANLPELWAAFAKRGLGFLASSPASSTTVGLRESFDLPDDLRIAPAAGFTGKGPTSGPFTPAVSTFTLTSAGSNAFNWTVVNPATWLDVSPTHGTLTPGGPTGVVTASLNAEANSMTQGIYAAVLRFTNQNSGVGQSRTYMLRVNQPDHFTEMFDTEPNDLNFSSFTFTPDGSSSFYSVCREPAVGFPTAPTGGTTLVLSDDTNTVITLTGGQTVALYNRRVGAFFLGSNGYLTLDSGDNTVFESLMNHFSQPRVSALFDDLNPATGGTVSWKQTSQLVAVTFSNVPKYATTNTVSFQLEMFFDGRIRLTYLAINIKDGLIGLSAGSGLPLNFLETDFSATSRCLPPCKVTVPATVTEGAGLLAGAGQVNLVVPLATNLPVALTVSVAGEISVSNTVVIAGQTNAAFDIFVHDEGLLDGAKTVRVTATASGQASSSGMITILDNETTSLHVNLPATITEGAVSVPGTVSVDSAPSANIVVNLTSSDTTEIQVPATVTILAGQTSAVFIGTVLDDTQIDGPQTVNVTAQAQNWTEGSAAVTVSDNESFALTVTLPPSACECAGMLTNAGQVRLNGTLTTNLKVTLASSDLTELTVPSSVTILAGQLFTNFHLITLDDSVQDDMQSVTVTATAAGFVSGVSNINVLDDESPPLPYLIAPRHLATNIITYVNLYWYSEAISGEITYDVYFGTNPTPGAEELLGTTTATSWSLPQLSPLTTYYWQVVAHGVGTTRGPIWQFTTKGVDRFDWSEITSPQLMGVPIPVTITARDAFGNVVNNFTGPINLRAWMAGEVPGNTILGDMSHDFSMNTGNATLGYTFTPNTNLTVTHVRHYSGSKVSIWTDSGTLLGSQDVVSTAATWIETPLTVPVELSAGTRYRVGVYSGGKAYYWRGDGLAYFNHGTIDGNCVIGGDRFPNGTNQMQWAFVDLRYTISALMALASSPTNSGNFVNGAWTGNLTVFQPVTNMYFAATDSVGHRATSANFDVLPANDLSVAINDQPDPVSVNGYLTNVFAVVNSGPATATGVAATNFLPPSASFITAVVSQGSYVLVGQRVECNLGILAAGAAATVTVVTTPGVAGQITNWVTVGRAEADSIAGNNSATATTTVVMPALSIADAGVVEGDSGQTDLAFLVQLAPAVPQPVTVKFATANGTAQAGSDYVATNGTLTFVYPETSKLIKVTILGDTDPKPDKTFFLNLTAPTNAALARAQAIGTITNDDVPTLAEALDTPNWTWLTGGTMTWLGQTTNTQDNVDAGRSGLGVDNQEGWMETTVQGPGTVRFWWKVSSESTFDYLRFLVDDVEVTRISGFVNWTQFTNHIADGDHTLRWRYTKDASTSSGSDGGWVDQISVIPDPPTPPSITIPPVNQTVAVDSTATFSVLAIGAAPLSYQWQKNQTNLHNSGHYSGCTTATLSIFEADANDVANYRCVVTNIAGSTNSTSASLTVITPNPCITILNSDFENGFSLAGGGFIASHWTEWEADAGVAIGYDEPSLTHGGNHSQRIRIWGGTNGSSGGVYQRIPVTAGQPYAVSVWVYAGDPLTTCSLGVNPAGGTNAASGVTWSSASTNVAWIQKAWAGTVTANHLTVFYKVSSPDNVKRNGYFDDAPAGPNEPLALATERNGDALTLIWPECPNARLERATSLAAPASWTTATNQVSNVGGQKRVTLTPTGNAGFFRLVRQ